MWKRRTNGLKNVIRGEPSSESATVDHHGWRQVSAVLLPFRRRISEHWVVVLWKVGTLKSTRYTFFKLAEIQSKALYDVFWASFCNAASAHLVSPFHVLKINVFILLMGDFFELAIKLLVWTLKVENTMLSEVFLQNLNSIDIIIFSLLHCAILSITKAIILLVRWVAMWTSPGDKLWLEVDKPNDRLDVLCHVLDKV